MVVGENEDEKAFFSNLEDRGEAAIRADLHTNHFGTRAALARKWLNLKEEERAQQDNQLRVREIYAAEKAENAAQDSAKSAKDAAIWAKWSLFVGLAALFVSAFPYFKI